MHPFTQPIIELLRSAYAAELEAVATYLANSPWLDGAHSREVRHALTHDIHDELGHARILSRRLQELGAPAPEPFSLEKLQRALTASSARVDVDNAVGRVITTKEEAIERYRRLIAACDGRDYVTQDLVLEILADEERHHALFAGFATGRELAFVAVSA